MGSTLIFEDTRIFLKYTGGWIEENFCAENLLSLFSRFDGTSSQSCSWVGLTHGWVALGRDFVFLVVWVGWVHYSKSTKIWKDYVNAFKARLDKIC